MTQIAIAVKDQEVRVEVLEQIAGEESRIGGHIADEVTRVLLMVERPKSHSSGPVAKLVSQLGIFPTFLESGGP